MSNNARGYYDTIIRPVGFQIGASYICPLLQLAHQQLPEMSFQHSLLYPGYSQVLPVFGTGPILWRTDVTSLKHAFRDPGLGSAGVMACATRTLETGGTLAWVGRYISNYCPTGDTPGYRTLDPLRDALAAMTAGQSFVRTEGRIAPHHSERGYGDFYAAALMTQPV